MDIDRREPVRLGESTQWIRIRAANARNPLLLLVQKGPGLPMLNEVRTFERVLSLEDDFTVIYWDQRGCGRSLRSADASRDLSLQTMVSDTERLLAMLCDRFDRPAVVAGFSMGAMIAARATARRPDLVATLVAVSMDIDGAAAGKNAYEFALGGRTGQEEPPGRSAAQSDRATTPPRRLKGSRRARGGRPISAVSASGRPTTRWPAACWPACFAPPTTRSRTPSGPSGGCPATQAALLPELEALDLTDTLPSLNCPIVMVQGRHDQIAPASAAERYAELLTAPSKQFVWFEHSAHMPQLDEPGRFREVLAKVRLGLPANS